MDLLGFDDGIIKNTSRRESYVPRAQGPEESRALKKIYQRGTVSFRVTTGGLGLLAAENALVPGGGRLAACL